MAPAPVSGEVVGVVVADAVLLKVPLRLYERVGLRRLIVRPAGAFTVLEATHG